MLAAAALIAQAGVVAFAPPAGVPLKIVTETAEGDGADRRRFRSEHVVTFTPASGGFRAEVRILHVEGQAADDTRAVFEAAYAALGDRTIAMTLDGAGRVIAIDDREALWALLCAAVGDTIAARRAPAAPAHAGLAAAISGQLRTLPAERQIAVLGSLAEVAAAQEPDAAPRETHGVAVDAGSPFGSPLRIPGIRRVEPAGIALRSVTSAAADLTEGGAGRVAIERTREYDPMTGLLLASVDTVETSVSDGRRTVTTRRRKTVQIARAADR